MALIDEGYPLLVFAPRGPAQAGLLSLADEMRGAARACCSPRPPARRAQPAARRDRVGRARPDLGDPELLPDGRGARARARLRSRTGRAT
jgi:hypothetical protein